MSGDGTKAGDASAMRQALSDLMDGEADESSVLRACQAWRVDEDARAHWHAYHVIGDVLRTPELSPRGLDEDAAFLAAIRRKLAQEPIVVAPQAASLGRPTVVLPGAEAASNAAMQSHAAMARGGKGRWRAPVAVAAGFMAVAGVVVVTRLVPVPTLDETLATSLRPGGDVQTKAAPVKVVQGATPEGSASHASGVATPAGTPATLVINDQRMLRDARLDRYLEAHRQFGEGPVSATPGGVVRSVSTLAPDR